MQWRSVFQKIHNLLFVFTFHIFQPVSPSLQPSSPSPDYESSSLWLLIRYLFDGDSVFFHYFNHCSDVWSISFTKHFLLTLIISFLIRSRFASGISSLLTSTRKNMFRYDFIKLNFCIFPWLLFIIVKEHYLFQLSRGKLLNQKSHRYETPFNRSGAKTPYTKDHIDLFF